MAVETAVEAFSNAAAWRAMMRCAMQKDFSWKVSAVAYSSLYRRLLGA
jgi:glycogen synthase